VTQTILVEIAPPPYIAAPFNAAAAVTAVPVVSAVFVGFNNNPGANFDFSQITAAPLKPQQVFQTIVVPGTPSLMPQPPIAVSVNTDGCFTKIYTCESCCVTGKDPSGVYGCWNNIFTPQTCCSSGSPQNPTPTYVAQTVIGPSVAVSNTNCRDQLATCSYWAQAGMCAPSALYTADTTNYVKQYCPLSCSQCPRRSLRDDSVLARPEYRGKVDSRGIPYDDAGQPLLPFRPVPPHWSADAAAAAADASKQASSSPLSMSPLSIGLICGALFVAILLVISGVIYVHRRRPAPSPSAAETSSGCRSHELA